MTDFAQKMTDILNHGVLNLAMAIGYKKTGFLMMEDLGRPAAIPEIADALPALTTGILPNGWASWCDG
ncbi:MAG: hypothetical protein R2860_04605 [Desulfobacterales bacterium]